MTNVVRLKSHTSRKTKTPKSTAGKKPATVDAGIVRQCVAYAQAVGAFAGGFMADPSGNATFCYPSGSRYLKEAHRALARAARKRSFNFEGVLAKARISALILSEINVLSDVEFEFLKSFISDVRTQCEAIPYRESNSAKPGKAPDQRGVS